MSTTFSLVSCGWPGKVTVLTMMLLHPACSGSSAGSSHCGSRPPIPHHAKISPATSRVS